MKLTLTKIVDRNKVSAKGKAYVSRSILCNEYGDRWLSGFAGEDNASWKEGDTVEADVATKGEYLNFSVPKATHKTVATGFQPAPDILRLERKIDAILAECIWIRTKITGQETKEYHGEPNFDNPPSAQPTIQ